MAEPKLRECLWLRGRNAFHTGWLMRVLLEPKPTDPDQAMGWEAAEDTDQGRCLEILQMMIERGDLIVGPLP